MLTPTRTTLICPYNDLESQTILELAESIGLTDIRRSKQGWGAKLNLEPSETLRDCQKAIVIIEIPGPIVEENLRNAGHTLHIIDHHYYGNSGEAPLDRRNAKTSLEQFADLFAIKLNRRQQLVALHDKGAVNALVAESDASRTEIDAIVKEELLLQQFQEDKFEIAKEDWKKRACIYSGEHTKLKEPPHRSENFTIVTTTLKETSWIAHLAQRPTEQELLSFRDNPEEHPLRTRSVLILSVLDDRVIEINFFGTRTAISRLLELSSSLPPDTYEIWSDGGSGSSGYFGGKKKPRREQEAYCDDLADLMLAELVDAGRPVLRMATCLLFPFVVENNSGALPGEDWQRVGIEDSPYSSFESDSSHMTQQEYLYFHPYVREVMFPPAASCDCPDMPAQTSLPIHAVDYFRYTKFSEKHSCELQLTYPVKSDGKSEEIISHPLIFAGVHRFPDGLHILTLKVRNDALDFIPADAPFWKACMMADTFRKRGLTWGQVLYFNELSRKIFPAFPEQFEEGKIAHEIKIASEESNIAYFLHNYKSHPEVGENSMSSVITDLIDSFFSAKGTNPKPVLDDRMIAHIYLAQFGDKPRSKAGIDEYDALFLRTMYVEPPGTGYPYDKNFIKAQAAPQIYRRWAMYGSQYGFTRYSSTYTGFGGGALFFYGDYSGMYYSMAVIALYYRAFLVWFSGHVASATSSLKLQSCGSPGHEERTSFLEQKQRFMLFSNIYWFKEISNQDQGIELFSLYQKAFDFAPMYNQVKEEIDRADEFLETMFRIKQEDWNCKVGKVGLYIALIAFVTSFFGMNFNIITGPTTASNDMPPLASNMVFCITMLVLLYLGYKAIRLLPTVWDRLTKCASTFFLLCKKTFKRIAKHLIKKL